MLARLQDLQVLEVVSKQNFPRSMFKSSKSVGVTHKGGNFRTNLQLRLCSQGCGVEGDGRGGEEAEGRGRKTGGGVRG